jgi:hypothetical protein
MMNVSASDAPPGMIWRETLADGGVTNIYCSGAAPATPLANLGKAFIVVGVALAFIIGSTFGTKAAGPWSMPLSVLAIGVALAFIRRPGGPSTLSIAAGPGELRFSRGFWLNPLRLAPANVRDVLVGTSEMPFDMTTSGPLGGTRRYSGSERFVRVVLVEGSGATHVVACFAEEPCARFFARRVMTLVGELARARNVQGPFR